MEWAWHYCFTNSGLKPAGDTSCAELLFTWRTLWCTICNASRRLLSTATIKPSFRRQILDDYTDSS